MTVSTRARTTKAALFWSVASLAVGSSVACSVLSRTPKSAGSEEHEACLAAGAAPAIARCLALLARKAGNAAWCREIADADASSACLLSLAEDTGDGTVCATIRSPTDRTRCASASVRAGGDPKVCSELGSSADRATCLTTAALRGEPTLCLQIDASERFACLSAVQDALDDPAAACGNAPKCLAEMGRLDVTACERIPEPEAALRTQCLYDALSLPGWAHGSLCERLHAVRFKDECYSLLGQRPRHGGMCAKVQDRALRQACTLAAGHIDPGYCAALGDPSAQKSCVAASDWHTTDTEVCRELGAELKQDCLRITGQELSLQLSKAR